MAPFTLLGEKVSLGLAELFEAARIAPLLPHNTCHTATHRLHSPSEFILNNAYLFVAAVISHNTQLSAYRCLIRESSLPFHRILLSF